MRPATEKVCSRDMSGILVWPEERGVRELPPRTRIALARDGAGGEAQVKASGSPGRARWGGGPPPPTQKPRLPPPARAGPGNPPAIQRRAEGEHLMASALHRRDR